MQERVIRKSILLAYSCDSGKRNFYIRDPLFFLFVNCARDPQRGQCEMLAIFTSNQEFFLAAQHSTMNSLAVICFYCMYML